MNENTYRTEVSVAHNKWVGSTESLPIELIIFAKKWGGPGSSSSKGLAVVTRIVIWVILFFTNDRNDDRDHFFRSFVWKLHDLLSSPSLISSPINVVNFKS